MGRMRLASLVGMTSGQAIRCPDTPELIASVEAKLHSALVGVSENGPESRLETVPVSTPLDGPSSALFVGQGVCLRRYLTAFLELMNQRHTLLADPDATRHRVTEVCARAMGVQRVSVWRCEENLSKICCTDLFERSSGKHSMGTVLRAEDFPSYFEALITERTIAAHDAAKDPRTDCFREAYLLPLGIKSMLDVPIWVDGGMVGALCVETTTDQRTWSIDDETFVRLLANFVSMSCERHLLPRE